MVKENICQECSQKDSCRQTFEKLGRTEGPSVTIKSILAFLLPLVIFIVSLAVFEKVFQKNTGISFLLAAGATSIYITVVWFLSKKQGK
jgi:positive regulator of sigma E activity